MEPLFQQLIVGLIPQPTSVPPKPYGREPLQRVFGDISRDHPYQQMAFAQGDVGAQFSNGPQDVVLVGPDLIQVQTPVMSAEAAREKVDRIQTVISERLQLNAYLLGGIKVIAHVAAPGQAPNAVAFVSEQLMQVGEQADNLGAGFFAGGIKYRRIDQPNEPGREDVLLIEPFVHDNGFLFIDYDVQRRQPFQGLGDLSGWIDDAFSFVRGPTIEILEGASNG